MTTLTVLIKVINPYEHHYQITVPFLTGTVTYEYYDDLFGFDHHHQFIEMVKNYVKPDKIEVKMN